MYGSIWLLSKAKVPGTVWLLPSPAMIAALPLRQRVIMVESVYLEQSDAEIAQAHAMTVVNVRQIRSRAKKALMKMMANEEEANE